MSQVRPIVVVSDDVEMNAAVREAVKGLNNPALKVREANYETLDDVTLRFINDDALLVFRLADPRDINLVHRLRSDIGTSGRLLALTKSDISLSQARALKRSGVDEILPYPVAHDELAEQIQRLAIPQSMYPVPYQGLPGARLGHVIAVCPVRGGIGASTLSVNLADKLQGQSSIFRRQTKSRVALVDLDVQFGTVGTQLDLQPSMALLQMAKDRVRPDRTFLQQSMQTHVSGMDVLTAPQELMPIDAFSRDQIAALLEALRADYDYVVLDVPRTLVDWLGAVVSECNRMLMVTDSTVPSVRQAYRLIDFFSREIVEPPIEIVVGQEKSPMFRSGHHKEAEKVLGRELRHWLPNDPRHARVALDRGQLLSSAANSSALSKAIRQMANKIITDLKNNTPTHPSVAA